MASTSSRPSCNNPSTAASGPGTKDSTSRSDRSSSSLAPDTMARTRPTATASSAASSTRMTPRLADMAIGLTTQGNEIPERSSGRRKSRTRNSGHPNSGRGQTGSREVLAAREPGRPGRVPGEAELARDPPPRAPPSRRPGPPPRRTHPPDGRRRESIRAPSPRRRGRPAGPPPRPACTRPRKPRAVASRDGTQPEDTPGSDSFPAVR